MHPFSSDVHCLYKITHFQSGSGVKFEARHPFWWAMLSFAISMALMFGGVFLEEAITGTEGGNGAVLFAAPGLLLFLFVAFRVGNLIHTYGSQNFGSIIISQGEISIEILDDEIRGILGFFAPIQALFGRPMRRKVVDQLNAPLAAILGYQWDVATINGETFVCADANIATIDSEGGESIRRLQITPFFRTQENAFEFIEQMLPYLDAWDGMELDIDAIEQPNENEQPDESDPSIA